MKMSDSRSKAIQAKEDGNSLYKQKKFEEALAKYDEAIALDPTDLTFHLNKAAVRIEQKQYEKCVEDCDRAVEVGRENKADFKLIGKAFARGALAFHKNGDLLNAKKYYEKSLTEHGTPETRRKLAEIEKMIKEEEKKSYINPELALEEKNKGKELFEKGDYPGALQRYTEAMKRDPTSAVLFSNRAACYQKLAEFKLALQDCDECIKLDPTFVKAYIRKGYALVALKEYSKANDAFRKALELEPNSKEAADGCMKCTSAFMSNPEETRKRALSDPEVQKILADPAMRLILEQMKSDPKAIYEHLQNPEVLAKMEKLMEAGLVSFA
ncbi:stress-induced-phosphoprotein 1-like [Brevipalpus obovatus]|uniref:stress-induced-phosphoprotein 1-like n=1 Tax=Brevipalpus obovatus TaxID=246614 RepID=UPI003D9EBFF4